MPGRVWNTFEARATYLRSGRSCSSIFRRFLEIRNKGKPVAKVVVVLKSKSPTFHQCNFKVNKVCLALSTHWNLFDQFESLLLSSPASYTVLFLQLLNGLRWRQKRQSFWARLLCASQSIYRLQLNQKDAVAHPVLPLVLIL